MLGANKPCSFLGDESKTTIQRSQFLPDDIVAPFPRYRALAANIRSRRRRKPAINIPVYRDWKTPWPFLDPTVDYDLHVWPEDDDVRNGAVEENCVYLDTISGGASCCALQVTMQASNMDQARWLYDQLIPLGPVMLALTAATPIFKGYLTDVDVRWRQLAMATDDRTTEELGQDVCLLSPFLILFYAHETYRAREGFPRHARAPTRSTYRTTLDSDQECKIRI